MKVKELIDILKTVNPNAEVVVDINGRIEYVLDAEETEEQNNPDEIKTCAKYYLIGY